MHIYCSLFVICISIVELYLQVIIVNLLDPKNKANAFPSSFRYLSMVSTCYSCLLCIGLFCYTYLIIFIIDEAEGYMYHTTMPTDALRDFHEISVETLHVGLPELKQAQHELGGKARDALEERDLVSVAAPGFQAPGVLVYYSPSQEVENVALMHAFQSPEAGSLQIAMGVPWALDEPAGLKTFRLGLFGLDKLQHIDQTVTTLTTAVDSVIRVIKSLSDTSTTATTTSSSSSLPKAA